MQPLFPSRAVNAALQPDEVSDPDDRGGHVSDDRVVHEALPSEAPPGDPPVAPPDALPEAMSNARRATRAASPASPRSIAASRIHSSRSREKRAASRNTIHAVMETSSVVRMSPVMVTFRGWSDPRHHWTDIQTIGRLTNSTIPRIDDTVRLADECSDARTTWYPAYKIQRIKNVVSRGSQVHQVFHAERAQSGPVTMTTVANTSPNSLADAAMASQVQLFVVR